MITEITTNFPEAGSPELADRGLRPRLSADDRQELAHLDEGAPTATPRTRSRASTTSTPRSRPPRNKHAQIEQNQESDLEFLKKLADRNHFELYVDEQSTLHFGRRTTRRRRSSRCVWGEGLLSFKPEANLAGQISQVEVYGWDPKTEGSDRRASPAPARNPASTRRARAPASGSRRSCATRRSSPTLRLRQPVFTQAEADQRAKAALNERAKQFLTGEAEAIGLPEIRARSQRGARPTSARRSRRPTTSSRRPTRSTATAIARASR